eukprot:SAG11_NODE_2192_length_3701_cov_5.319367_2_plen_201_part_00
MDMDMAVGLSEEISEQSGRRSLQHCQNKRPPSCVLTYSCMGDEPDLEPCFAEAKITARMAYNSNIPESHVEMKLAQPYAKTINAHCLNTYKCQCDEDCIEGCNEDEDCIEECIEDIPDAQKHCCDADRIADLDDFWDENGNCPQPQDTASMLHPNSSTTSDGARRRRRRLAQAEENAALRQRVRELEAALEETQEALRNC